jgi:hypothetical protein
MIRVTWWQPRPPFFACGSKEGAFFCVGFGSFAAKTNAIKRFSALLQAKDAYAGCGASNHATA